MDVYVLNGVCVSTQQSNATKDSSEADLTAKSDNSVL